MALGDDQVFVYLKPDHHFQEQDPSLIITKNNQNPEYSDTSSPSFQHPMCLTLFQQGGVDVNNHQGLVTRVSKLRLNSRDCFLQVLMALRGTAFD